MGGQHHLKGEVLEMVTERVLIEFSGRGIKEGHSVRKRELSFKVRGRLKATLLEVGGGFIIVDKHAHSLLQ